MKVSPSNHPKRVGADDEPTTDENGPRVSAPGGRRAGGARRAGQKLAKMTRMSRHALTLPFVLFPALSSPTIGDDWPTYRHDNHHSGVTAEELDASRLTEVWVHRSAQPPRPAWA